MTAFGGAKLSVGHEVRRAILSDFRPFRRPRAAVRTDVPAAAPPLTDPRGLPIVAAVCTLIVGRDVVAPGSVLLAANRDEDPARPTDPPRVLAERPRIVGGRDRIAGGTWLAVRDARAVVALLNRRDRSGGPAPPAPGRRSRGALVMDVAAAVSGPPADRAGVRFAPPAGMVTEGLAGAASGRGAAAGAAAPYAPCTLVFATAANGWVMALEADAAPRFLPLEPGWHVVTHGDLDDPDEPRTARLLGELAGFAPRSRDQAEARLDALLRSHGDPDAGIAPVCLHEGRMVTVSSSSVWLAADGARYRHVEGRPCEHAPRDHTALLAGSAG